MPDLTQLSDREIEILRLVATGASNKEIARDLVISVNTVKVHMRNIFAKLEVASRTEASMWAVRNGLVTPVESQPEPATNQIEPATPPKPRWQQPSTLIAFLILALSIGGIIGIVSSRRWWGSSQLSALVVDAEQARWLSRPAMPVARSRFAIAVYNGEIIAFGGQTGDGITARVDSYNPEQESWTERAAKPLPVIDAQAAVIGGAIYIPGGITENGEPSALVEVYNPLLDTWSQRAALPKPLAAYALATFEGKLYLFGGWDGSQFIADVYAYDPQTDQWSAQPAMPTARGYAGAAVSGGRIYVIGGQSAAGKVAVNEEFTPGAPAAPWQNKSPLPIPLASMGVSYLADIVYVLGGEGDQSTPNLYQYISQSDEWQTFSGSIPADWVSLGVAQLGVNLYLMGGEVGERLTRANISYQAIYTVALPLIRQ